MLRIFSVMQERSESETDLRQQEEHQPQRPEPTENQSFEPFESLW
jgi:hypothetical protein